MAKPIPTASDVAKKWVTRGKAAEDDFVKGAKSATWKTEAVAGEANYKKAMDEVIKNERRKKGVERTSDDTWRGGIERNKDRYGTGIENSENEMASGIEPVLNDIKAEVPNLKARGPKGSAENFERSKQLGMKLHEKSLARKNQA